MIIGQEKICNKIDKLTTETMPRTILLLGEYGSGKHLIVEYIANKFNLEIEDISDKLSLETINEITQRVVPRVYIIDSAKLTIKNENVILKFLEEPLKNAFICVLATNRQNIIPTVLNRCQAWELAAYNGDYLTSFITNDNVNKKVLMAVANTPGKIKEYQQYAIDDMVALAQKMFNNMGNANFANALTLSRFIAFKQEKDKFDFNVFTDILLYVSIEYCKTLTKNCYDIYRLTNELNNRKTIFNIDKKALFDNYLINLRLLNWG